MHKLDIHTQKEFPTVMVPKFGELEECSLGRTRLLMGSDGLYVETRQPWGHLVSQLWVSPRPLPYGRMAEVDTFVDVFNEQVVPIAEQIEECATAYADKDLEWVGWVLWNEERGFWFEEAEFQASITQAKWKRSLPEGTHLVCDIHSHGRLACRFSPADDTDDKGGVKISILLGSYEKGPNPFAWRARHCIEGFFFNLDLEVDTEDAIEKEFEHLGEVFIYED